MDNKQIEEYFLAKLFAVEILLILRKIIENITYVEFLVKYKNDCGNGTAIFK